MKSVILLLVSCTALICGFPLGGEGDKTISGFFPNVDPVGCPVGWLQAGDVCYQFNQIHNTFDQARSSCKEARGTLAVINSRAEFEALKQLRISNDFTHDKYYWIGANQTARNSANFANIDGTDMVSGLWFPGEPNSIRSGMQCVNMGEIGQGYRLNDYTCANSLPYLCEIDL